MKIMKISNIFIILLIITLFSCAPKISQLPEVQEKGITEVKEEVTINTITDIKISEEEDSVWVTIEGAKTISYKEFRLADPLRLVIDIPDSNLGKFSEPLQINDGIITSIKP